MSIDQWVILGAATIGAVAAIVAAIVQAIAAIVSAWISRRRDR